MRSCRPDPPSPSPRARSYCHGSRRSPPRPRPPAPPPAHQVRNPVTQTCSAQPLAIWASCVAPCSLGPRQGPLTTDATGAAACGTGNTSMGLAHTQHPLLHTATPAGLSFPADPSRCPNCTKASHYRIGRLPAHRRVLPCVGAPAGRHPRLPPGKMANHHLPQTVAPQR